MICEYCDTEVFFEATEEEKKQRLAKRLAKEVEQYRIKFGELNALNSNVSATEKNLMRQRNH